MNLSGFPARPLSRAWAKKMLGRLAFVMTAFGLGALTPGAIHAATMKVITAIGQARVVQGDRSSALAQGMEINGPFSLLVEEDGYAQLRGEDGALIAVPESSTIQYGDATGERIQLQQGGLNLLAPKKTWTVETPTHQVRVSGYARLRICGSGCVESPGLYGKSVSGEVVVEYRGGRSVLRGKSFLAPPDGSRPEVLVRDIPLLVENPRLDRAAQTKAKLANEIKAGLEDFRSGKHDEAREILLKAQQAAPSEPVLAYYLGVIAMDKQDNAEALRQFERFNRDDPGAARERGVGQLITLLTANRLRQEVADAVKQEQAISSLPPEPNTIAIQPFSNRSNPIYAPLAKGIAAMIITDLSKVPGLKVLEREKVQKLLDEIRLGESGLVGDETAVKAGRLLRAEKVFVGTFGVEE